jgi:hypothetical protein
MELRALIFANASSAANAGKANKALRTPMAARKVYLFFM